MHGREEVCMVSRQDIGTIIDRMGEPLFVKDQKLRYVYANNRVRKIFGFLEGSLTGKTDHDIFLPDQADILQRNDNKVLDEGKENTEEYKFTDGAGNSRIIAIKKTLYTSEAGKKYLVGTVRDITERRNAEKAAAETERKLRTLVDNIPDGIVRFDVDRRFTFVNPSVEKVFHMPAAAITGKTLSEVAVSETEERKKIIEESIRRTFDEGTINSLELELTTLQGIRYCDFLHVPEPDETGKVTSVLGITHDVTERKKAEITLLRLNRELRAISDCNQILLRATDEEKLVNDICHIIRNEAGYPMAWVGYVQNDDAKSIRPAAWAGIDGEYLADANITWADTKQGQGPMGTAIREGKTAYVQDFTADPRTAPWRERLLGCGFRSSIAFPLKDENGRTFGGLNIHSTEPNAFTTDEIRLLEELAGDLAFGIMVLRARSERARAQEALLESEQKYRTVVENSLVGVYIVQDGLFRFVNRRWCEIYGYPEEEAIDRIGPLDLTAPEDLELVRRNIELRLNGEAETLEYVVRALRKDGRIIAVRIFGSSITYKGQPAICGTILDISEQARAQEELLQQTALLEAQVNASLDGIVVADQGKIILQNRQFNTMFSIPEHISENNDDPAQIEWFRGLVKNIDEFDEKVAYHFAHPEETVRDELELKNGRVLDRYSSTVFGKDGRRYGRIWTFRDITERKRSEEVLRKSRLRLAEAMDLADIVYWEVDWATGEFIFNDPFYALYGTTVEQEGGYRMSREEYIRRFVHPDDWEFFYQLVRQNDVDRVSLVVDVEHRIIRRDGEVRHVFVRTRIVRDNTGRVLQVYGTNQDITKRKRMEVDLEEREEQFRKIFEESPLGMVMTALDTRYIKVNRAFSNMLGYTEKEMASMTVREVTHPDDIEKDIRNINDLVNNRIPVYRTEKRYIKKNGEIMQATLTISAMRGANNRLLYFLGTIEDITQQKQAEEEKKLLELQLFRAQKMEAIGTLAGGIAHDFNNILTALVGYAALLKMKANDEALLGYVNHILAASQKATDLIRSLLAFSRQQTPDLKPVRIHSIIRETEKLLKRLVTEDVTIKTIPAAEDMTIMADATQIDQILFNLAANARDAMPHGGILTIETKAVQIDERFRHFHGYGKPGRYVLLSVSDTGIGMDRATQERIFDPFFTTKEVGKGTGLGLSTVYGIVKQHGGYITVYSEPGIGTSFHIRLPIFSGTDVIDEPRPTPVRGGTETVLVAEDNEAVRSLIRDILTEYGYTIIEARDGEDAIEKFRKTPAIDLLILDSVMPRINGREAYDEILRIKPTMKAIFTSGYTRDVVLDKGIEDGKLNFVQKPVSPDTLLEKVREVLDSEH